MTVSTIASLAASLSRTSFTQNSKTNAVFNVLFNLNNDSKSAQADVNGISAAINLQNQVAQLRVASQNVAQASSLLAAAEDGASDIATDVARLKDIATRASSASISEEERAGLKSQFEVIRGRIDRVANSTRFNNEALLNGASPQLKLAAENKDIKELTIGSLTDAALFKGRTLNIGTAEGAKAAEAIIKEAQVYANQQLDNVRAIQAGLDVAASTLESTIQNQDAARSTLNENDFTLQLLTGKGALQGDGINSLFAQTNRLPTNLLSLLSE
jgi:flagellin